MLQKMACKAVMPRTAGTTWLEELIGLADTALLGSKAEGRNRVRIGQCAA